MDTLDRWWGSPVATSFNLIIEDKDKIGRILVHTMFSRQEELSAILPDIVHKGTRAHSCPVTGQKHGNRIDLSFLHTYKKYIRSSIQVGVFWGTPAKLFSQATSMLQDWESPKFFV